MRSRSWKRMADKNFRGSESPFGIRNSVSWAELQHTCPSFGRTNLPLPGRCNRGPPESPSAHLVTLPRALLVTALANLCEQSRVRLRFHSDAGRLHPSHFDGFDLVVAADGAHSAVRRLYGPAFGTLVRPARNFYGWFGANVPLQKLTIMLADTEGVLLAWGYKYTACLSTLIVGMC